MSHVVTKPISRTFQDLRDDSIGDGARLKWQTEFGIEGFGWDTLLESDRIVIVSEAGVGKTYECESQAKELWDHGNAAFFLDLAQLAQGGLRSMLMPEQEERFDEWLAGEDETAVFFLDSYDELRLSTGSLRQALTHLVKEVRGNLWRTVIVMTTRPIPFEEKLLRQLLDVPSSAGEAPGPETFANSAVARHGPAAFDEEYSPVSWRFVTLQPLSDDQILALAVTRGVAEPHALMNDIIRRNGQEFARRPQDLIELCADWNAHKRIRTHREQVAANITVKLRPREGKERQALAHDKAFDGASRLALAMLLTRKLTLRHNANSDQVEGLESALDPAAILSNWSREEIETLLERALFGFATYGRVRFHHRSVWEYLATERLRTKLAAGMSESALKRLIFAETPRGEVIVRPSMRPVAGWLASTIDPIFAQLLVSEPEVLLCEGDPETLTIDKRRRALRAYVRRYGQGRWRGMAVPHIQSHRFTDPELASEILSLWHAGIENPEVRCLLLGFMENGFMEQGADIAISTAMDSDASHRERLEALDVAITFEDPRLEKIAASVADDPALWPEETASDAAIQLFSQLMSPAQFCKVLARLDPQQCVDQGLEWRIDGAVETGEFSAEDLHLLCEEFARLVDHGIEWNMDRQVMRSSRMYLASGLGRICLRLIECGDRSEGLMRATVLAMRIAPYYDHREVPRARLQAFLEDAQPDVREKVFWADLALVRRTCPPVIAEWQNAHLVVGNPIGLDYEKDGAWLLAAVSDRSRSSDERGCALEILIRHGEPTTDRHSRMQALRNRVLDSPDLVLRIDEDIALAPDTVVGARIGKRAGAAELISRIKGEMPPDAWAALWEEVAHNVDRAFSPSRAEKTLSNLWIAMSRRRDGAIDAAWSRRFMERHFGAAIADRGRTALMEWWRGLEVALPSERREEDRFRRSNSLQLAAAAISAEAEDPEWARRLTMAEARLAARIAAFAPQRFPVWFAALVCEWPVVVDDVLGAELIRDLGREAESGDWSRLMRLVRRALPEETRAFLPRLCKWLAAAGGHFRTGEDPEMAVRRIDEVAQFLLDHGDEEHCELVESLARNALAETPDPACLTAWLPVMMRVDAVAATLLLEEYFADTPIACDGLAVSLIGDLFGGASMMMGLDPAGEPFLPEVLLRLTRFAYRHVPRCEAERFRRHLYEDDRELAENGREELLQALLSTTGPGAWQAKIALASDPDLVDIRDHIIRVAWEKAAEEAEGPPFSDEQAVAVDARGEAPPATTEAMFAILRDRVEGLDDLMLSDCSPREAWSGFTQERVMRREIAREMRNRAQGLYTVDQEGATADEKETDLRMRVAVSGQQAVIELKLAENNSFQQLRAAIRDQLVTKYMAPLDCRAGCLLITCAKKSAWRHPETGDTMDFPDLIAELQEEARSVVAEAMGEIRILVKGLDLRPRLAIGKHTSV